MDKSKISRVINKLIIKSKSYKREGILVLTAIIVAASVLTIKTYNQQQAVETIAFQNTLESKLLRFHVRGNSDKFEDQSLKLAIRDKILAYLSPKMKKCKTINQSKRVITKNIKTIKKIAYTEVKNWNKDYTVDVYIGKSQFPTKRYGDLVFPAGKYDALQVVLGKGKGQNWWCVMFPPLCLTDVVAGSVPYDSKKKIKDVIGSKYYVIIDQGNKKKHKAKVVGRFKTIEIFESAKKRVCKWINGD